MIEDEKLLKEALQKKGIGPKGSKKIDPQLVAQVLPLLANEKLNLNTRAAFWAACLILDAAEEEKKVLSPYINNPEEYLPDELRAFLDPSIYSGTCEEFLSLLRQVIQKKDLTSEESERAMELFWSESVPEWAKGAFLQATRLKRETIVENFRFFQSLYERVDRQEVELPALFDLADSYDGSNRSYQLAPYIAATLAAAGYQTVIHGVRLAGPKYGITSHQLLEHSGKKTDLKPEEAVERLLDPSIGWTYIDQREFHPDLYRLKQLREDIIKRPFLTTFEKLLQPIRNKKGNILISGYVHSPYRERLVNLLRTQDRCEMYFVLHSIEGSTNCRVQRNTELLGYRKEKEFINTVDIEKLPEVVDDEISWLREQEVSPVANALVPEEFGIRTDLREVVRGIQVEDIAKEAEKALQGEQGTVFDLLTFHAASFLYLAGKTDSPAESAALIRETILSGKALLHWKRYT